MKSRKWQVAIWGCTSGVILLGLYLTIAYGPRPSDHAIHIRMVSLIEHGSGFHCKWEFTGPDSWVEQSSSTGPGGGQKFVLQRDIQPWFSPHSPSQNSIKFDVDVKRSKTTSKPTALYSESVQVTVTSLLFSSTSGGSYMVPAKDNLRQSAVVVRADTIFLPPASIVLATVSGQPVTVEFRR